MLLPSCLSRSRPLSAEVLTVCVLAQSAAVLSIVFFSVKGTVHTNRTQRLADMWKSSLRRTTVHIKRRMNAWLSACVLFVLACLGSCHTVTARMVAAPYHAFCFQIVHSPHLSAQPLFSSHPLVTHLYCQEGAISIGSSKGDLTN